MGMIETFKEVAELVQKADNIDLMRKLMGAQNEAMGLLAEVQSLRDQVRTLNEQLAIQGELIFHKNAYWRSEDGPFCSRCWDKERTLIRLHSVSAGYGCPACKTWITLSRPR